MSSPMILGATIHKPCTLPNSRPLSLQEAVGTPYYMAPEQINGKPCPASDQYALGVIVYEWLCGTRPFRGSSYGELFFQHLSKQPPPLHETVPLIPPTVEAVVLKTLAKDPQERFPSVQAFADALKQAYAQDMHILAGDKGQTPNENHKQVLADSDKQMLISRSEQILINSEQTLERIPTKQRLTRRTVLAAVAGGGSILVLAAGVAGYFPTLFGSHSQAAPNAPPTSSVGGATKSQNTPTGQATRTPQSTPTPTPGTTSTTYSGHSQEVKAVAWSPDGTRIASGSLDGTVQVWDAATGKNAVIYGSLAATQGVKNIAWSSDGKYLATGNENSTVRVWNVASGQEVLPQAYTGHTSAVRSVAWQPGGTLIASASQDGTVQVWSGLTGQLVSSYRGHSSSWALSVAWSPDGTQIVSGYADGTVHVWNATSAQRAFPLNTGQTQQVWSLAWSHNGQHIAAACQSGQAQVLVWAATTQQLVFTSSVPAHMAEAVACSPDSTLLAAGDNNGTVQIWNITTQQLTLTYYQQSKTIWSVAWSPDGKRIASASADRTVKVWWA